jgi:putative Mn2+ efflux pump MntP
MNWSEIILIAVALAMDAFAVAIASGAVARKFHLRHALTMGAWFGAFQAIMPVLGWAGGISLRRFIAGVDHWVAFGLLSFIGCKMIYESFKIEAAENPRDPLDVRVLFILSLATSIDAFAVGISFAMIGIPIVAPVIVIGAVTFVMSFVGVRIGAGGAHFFEKKVEIVAGLVLIGIGIKILLTDLLR